MKVRNTFAIFLVSGFWHGANWTFIIWGALNAIYFLPLLLTNNNRKNLGVVAEGKLLPSVREIFGMFTTFILTVFAWIFFRAENLNHALNYIKKIFIGDSIFIMPNFIGYRNATYTLCLIVCFLFFEWVGRENKFAIEEFKSYNKTLKWIIYLTIFFMIFNMASNNDSTFIYFQF